MVLPTPGGGYAGGRAVDNRDLHRSMSEKNCPIYHDTYNIGAVSGSRAATGGTGPKAAVGIGGASMGGRVGGEHGGGCGWDRDEGDRGEQGGGQTQ